MSSECPPLFILFRSAQNEYIMQLSVAVVPSGDSLYRRAAMKIEICLDRQELQGRKMVRFEVRDSGGANIGAFFVGKGGICWQKPRGSKNYKSKSWHEVITWLERHGRTIAA
jgi:hypothetical protein